MPTSPHTLRIVPLNTLVADFLRRHPPGRRLCVGYSGGLDSTVLLHLLAGLRGEFELSAVHVHHGLSPHADAWAEHCIRQCAALDLPLRVARVSVERAGLGLEAAAREARYRVFAQLDVDALALAHHRDDQAETVLLQLLRGGGLKGLAAMPEERGLGPIKLLRPLLDLPRRDLAAYALDRGLVWVDDASNDDTALRRNATRHQFLPRLESLFPGAAVTLAQAAAQFAESAELLDALARLDAAVAINAEGVSLACLAEVGPARARNLLRHYLDRHGIPIRRERLHEALAQMLAARPDAQPAIEFAGAALRRFRDRVVLVPHATARAGQTWSWRGQAELDLGAAGSLSFTPSIGQGVALPFQATVSLRGGGEKLQSDARRPQRTLKNLLREAGVPPWQRAHLPLVYVAGRLAWAAEIGADAAFQAGPGVPGWLISWRRPA
jgi:tRNA(Ile)-lysidine synthase